MKCSPPSLRSPPLSSFCTIITDAGWQPIAHTATWAGRVIADHGSETFHGEVKSRPSSSNAAEFIAVVNTIHSAMRSGAIQPEYGWLIQLDNVHVIDAINFAFKHRNTNVRQLPSMCALQRNCLRTLESLAELAQPNFVLARHVKAHIKPSARAARHHVQQSMDDLCRKNRT